MAVYRITVGSSFRYIRAVNALAAAIEAARVWNKGVRPHVENIGNYAPDIGRLVYNRIVCPPEDVEDYDIIQYTRRSTGKLTTKENSFYRPTPSTTTKRTIQNGVIWL